MKIAILADIHANAEALEIVLKKAKQKKKQELDSINRISVFYREYLCEIVGYEENLFRE